MIINPVVELSLTFTNQTGVMVQFDNWDTAVSAREMVKHASRDEVITIYGICNTVTFDRSSLITVQLIDCAKFRELSRVVSIQQALDQVRIQREAQEAIRNPAPPANQTN